MKKLNRKHIIIILIVLVPPLFFLVPMLIPDGSGSEAYAREWSAKFKDINSFEEARKRYPGIDFFYYPDDSWVFGVCKNSHGHIDGGTIVIKDSNGKISCYFGHVCGEGFLRVIMKDVSLKEFYKGPIKKFKEYKIEQKLSDGKK